MTEQRPSSRRPRARNVAIIALLILVGLSLAFLSTAPSVDVPSRPAAEDIAAARDLARTLRESQLSGTPVKLELDARQIGALGLLAGEAAGLRRVETELGGDIFSARASLPAGGGLWINAAATMSGTHQGFPTIHLKVGRVPLPAVASRWAIDIARWLLVKKGVQLPTPDKVVRHFEVAGNRVGVELALPQNTGIVKRVVSVAGANVDHALAARIYCRLAQAQPAGETPQLATLVRQTFRGAGGTNPAAYNRAAFVALAFYVVGEQAYPLALEAADRSRSCPAPAATVLLQERDDLAKHWAFSAALAAVLGEQRASSLGEWKELHDSLPSGSGFSFVDLAADRSGLHVARGALDPGSAGSVGQTLKTASDEDLLPEILTQAPEGLSDVEFTDSFGGLDENRYRDAVSLIDRHLAHWRP